MGIISRERIDKFNPVTDVLDKLLRDEDIKRINEERGILQQDGMTREEKLQDIAKYLAS